MFLDVKYIYGNESLCWCCKKSACNYFSECRWARSGKPVEGWKTRKGRFWSDSVIVETCPEFVADNDIQWLVKEIIYKDRVRYLHRDQNRILHSLITGMKHLDYDAMSRVSYLFLIDSVMVKTNE